MSNQSSRLYPHWAIAHFALLVWQGGALIAAEPLSWVSPCLTSWFHCPGCLSRRTPTRATRAEARRHRSALTQNPLLMYPFFSFLWTCRRSGVSSPYGGLAPMCLRCGGCTLPGFARWHYFVDMWVAEGHTQHDDRGPGTQQVPMVVRPSWEQWSLRGCV